MTGGERELSAEEIRIWQEAMGERKPDLGLDAFMQEVEQYRQDKQQTNRIKKVPQDPLVPGSYANIDRATKRTVRRGHMQVDAGLDLHGLNAEDAWVMLKLFVREQVDAGSRLILIITGKGRSGEGRLRALMPQWVNEPDLRPYILSVDAAGKRDGGSGAWYLLLKQKRKMSR